VVLGEVWDESHRQVRTHFWKMFGSRNNAYAWAMWSRGLPENTHKSWRVCNTFRLVPIMFTGAVGAGRGRDGSQV
jgi:hypothetical protein